MLVQLSRLYEKFILVSSTTLLQVGTADALAFFLPGVVSQFAKVLHASKAMASGAAGSAEAIDQALRGLAEFLMIVLHDDANMSSLEISLDVTAHNISSKSMSTQAFMEELRNLPLKAQQGQGISIAEDSSGQVAKRISPEPELSEHRTDSGKRIGSLLVNRTKDWIEKTAAHVDKLLASTFPEVKYLFRWTLNYSCICGLSESFFWPCLDMQNVNFAT